MLLINAAQTPSTTSPQFPASLLRSFLPPKQQVIHLIRHGQTEMNVHLHQCTPQFGQPGFIDPILIDTRLTPTGIAQAQRLATRLATTTRTLRPDAIIISPLARALDTAMLALPPDAFPNTPRIVHPLARERCYLSSDRGRPWGVLAEEYTGHDWSHMPDPDTPWWGPPGDPDGVENAEHLQVRVEQLRQWLEQRPERCLVLVAHWAVIMALTGESFRNCEMQQWRVDRLKARPWLLEK